MSRGSATIIGFFPVLPILYRRQVFIIVGMGFRHGIVSDCLYPRESEVRLRLLYFLTGEQVVKVGPVSSLT